MVSNFRKLWFELTNPRVKEESQARQEYQTRVIFVMVSVALVVMTVIVFLINYGIGEPDVETTIIMLGMDLLVLIGWGLIGKGKWQAGSILLPVVFLTFAGYMVFSVGLVTTSVLQLAIALLLAGMLSGNRARWIMFVICFTVYLVAGWAGGERDIELFLIAGITLFMSLGGIALLDWFFSNLLNNSLRTVREREAKLQSIFRAAPIGIGMVIDRVIQEANDTLCQITGYSRGDLIGQNARMLYLSQEDYEYVGAEKYRQIHEKEVGTVETRWRRKDGEIRDILLSSAPINPSDLTQGVTFSALDITERKRFEKALQESEKQYRLLFDEMLSGFALHEIICDEDGKPIDYRFLAVNNAFEKLTGLKANNLIGKTVWKCCQIPNLSGSSVMAAWPWMVLLINSMDSARRSGNIMKHAPFAWNRVNLQ